ncbi:hypothetical protein HMPREF1508_0813 [Shuttleworthella sp. MSX8B]|uniref:DegV family protein n=1 Tax=Shuttleworthella TaxID=177971 RepID=UPI0004507B20|nr:MULTISPECIES: DegV family protein [Shuttleworthia]EUB17534.1 hypothetical protein HMPREF1508_0813 [Shuttleworthia sp. MSX8B]
MSRVAVATDSNSGITQEEAKRLGVTVLPMPFYIDGQLYLEGVDLSSEEFYKKLTSSRDISTSMPAVGDVMDCWNRLLKDYEEVVYIPMSSGLSSSCLTARNFAEEEEYQGKVFVVDNHRISVTLKLSVIEAKKMADAGKSADQIRRVLEKTAHESSIYITLDTLEYLKRGGRLTPAAAMIGTLLHIKPVLQIQGEKLDTFAKARTIKQAKQIMLDAVASDLRNRFAGLPMSDITISMAHIQSREEADLFRQEARALWPDQEIIIDPLPSSIACHLGPGALAITCTRNLDDSYYA